MKIGQTKAWVTSGGFVVKERLAAASREIHYQLNQSFGNDQDLRTRTGVEVLVVAFAGKNFEILEALVASYRGMLTTSKEIEDASQEEA